VKRISGIIMLVMLLALAVAPWAGAAEKGKTKKAAKVNRAPYTDPTTGMQFVWVPGGCYSMGDTFGGGGPSEKPVHEVCVDGFYIGKYEVTVEEYYKFVRETGTHYPQWMESGSEYHYQSGSSDHYRKLGSALTSDKNPIVGVSWNDSIAYAQWLSGKSGKRFRLPTEAEWEFAARSGGKKEKWAGTSSEAELGEYAWYEKNSGERTHPVGQKRPNGLGLYDMSGNVWEWVSDWYGYYDEDWFKLGARKNPQGAEGGSSRVARGGSWDDAAGGARASRRRGSTPGYRDLGFRLVLPPVQ
jgi:formylglycine-generating enzyme required for sulfatase activity